MNNVFVRSDTCPRAEGEYCRHVGMLRCAERSVITALSKERSAFFFKVEQF